MNRVKDSFYSWKFTAFPLSLCIDFWMISLRPTANEERMNALRDEQELAIIIFETWKQWKNYPRST